MLKLIIEKQKNILEVLEFNENIKNSKIEKYKKELKELENKLKDINKKIENGNKKLLKKLYPQKVEIEYDIKILILKINLEEEKEYYNKDKEKDYYKKRNIEIRKSYIEWLENEIEKLEKEKISAVEEEKEFWKNIK